jgi:hypothetical protein
MDTQKRIGRPPGTGKPEGKKYLVKTFSIPPDLWRDVEAFIPQGDRSPLIQECLKRAVRRRKQAQEATDQQASEQE